MKAEWAREREARMEISRKGNTVVPRKHLTFSSSAPTWNGENVEYLNDPRTEAPELKYKASKACFKRTSNVDIRIHIGNQHPPVWLSGLYLTCADHKPGKGCDPKAF